MTKRLCAGVMLLAMLACGGGGGGGQDTRAQEPPADRKVKVRFIGPDGEVFYPEHVSIGTSGSATHPKWMWRMTAWAGGVYTEDGTDELFAGDRYVIVTSNSVPGVFWASNFNFTLPDGPIDLGVFDLRTRGFSIVSPTAGEIATSYPVEVVWSPYDNTAASYDAYLDANGPTVNSTVSMQGNRYTILDATVTGSEQRTVDLRMTVRFDTADGYSVVHMPAPIPFTLPP